MERIVRSLTVILVASALAVACGSGDDESQAAARKAGEQKAAEAAGKPGQATTATVKAADPAEEHLATAVADAKTTAPVDLLYDLPVKPEVGQPFTVEVVLKPRLPADALDLEIGDSPGIAIDGERAARFLNVEAGQLYRYTVAARGDATGLYYVTVIAKMSTNVQNEVRVFSVPVVVGNPPSAQKTEPPKDATGQPVESMPASER